MPTYDYICECCDHAFDVFQPITARALRKCPRCRRHGLKRLIGRGSGVIFKGTGFYETDYRSENYKKASEKEKDAATGKKAAEKDATAGTKAAGKTKTSGKEAGAKEARVSSQ